MSLRRNIFCSVSRQKSVKLARQTLRQIALFYLFGNVQRSIPGAGLRVNNELLFQLMMFYARELQESEKNMRNLAHMPVKGRVVQALLFLKDRFGVDEQGCLNLELSRQNLASFTGTTYESVFRILNELSEDNLMRLMGKRICLTDTARMEKMLAEIA